MFENILISALMTMDDDQLQVTLESMTYDELSYVDAVMEAKYTEQDLADFQDIMRIQNAAHRDGWKNVSKDDYDRYVDIMSNTKHLIKMHQAKKLGREKAIIDRDKQYIQGDLDEKGHIGNKIDDFKGNNLVRATAIIGGATGVGLPIVWGTKGAIAAAKSIKDHARFENDKKDLKKLGIKNHPDDQWQFNRVKRGLKRIKHELLRDRHIIPRKNVQTSTKPATESVLKVKNKEKEPETRINKIDRIIEIQKQARAKGWHNIEAKDRKYYIDTINSARNDKEFMRDLKRAKKIGDKAGDVDSNVLKATRAMALPAISIGGAVGNITAQDSYGKIVRARGRLPEEIRDKIKLPDQNHFTTAMGIGGTAVGTLANVGIQKIGEMIDKKRRRERDLVRLKELGEYTHPEDAWKKDVKYTKGKAIRSN